MSSPGRDKEISDPHVIEDPASPGGVVEITISGGQGAGKSILHGLVVAVLEDNRHIVSDVSRRVVVRTVQTVATMAIALLAATAAASPINLVHNGDFSLGAAGFDTDYAYSAINTDEGQYRTAATVAEWGHPLFVDFAPPAGAAGMLLLNGSTRVADLVWGQTVAVEAGASYVFSAALAGLCCVDGYSEQVPIVQARLLFTVNGVGLLMASPEGRAVWSAVAATWTATGPTARLEVFDLEAAYGGNDWAITAVAVTRAEAPSAVPEPATGALATVGALYGALRLWRARRAA